MRGGGVGTKTSNAPRRDDGDGVDGDQRDDEGPDGRYYRDDFNDAPWTCVPGTAEDSGVWMNTADQAGTVMALTVWFLLGYSACTMTMLAETGGIPPGFAAAYAVLACLALACHAKTTFTDPGTVPASAVPAEAAGWRRGRGGDPRSAALTMCSQCQTFKPPLSHHCRICNRCISKMDHHCPWMNNCIGAGNLKHFVLFLLYTWVCSASSLALMGWNYFFCVDDYCEPNQVLVQLIRIMTLLGIASLLFTSSMIMNVAYGLLTGIGTIDRLKKKATGTVADSTEEPVPLKDVFGTGGYLGWLLPTDPVFPDYDRVMGYSTPQRLLREQMMAGGLGGAGGDASRRAAMANASGSGSGMYTPSDAGSSRMSYYGGSAPARSARAGNGGGGGGFNGGPDFPEQNLLGLA